MWLNSVAYEHSQSKATETQYKRVWREFAESAGTTAEKIIEDYENSENNHISERTIMRKYSQIIQKWIIELQNRGLTTTSIKVMVGAVMSFFKYNDLSLGHIPQARSGVTYHNKDITKDEVIQIMAQVPIREKAFFAIMAQSGLRPHTIRQLRIENLERILEKEPPIPCKIDVPQEIEKGKFGKHPTFIGEEAVKLTKRYLDTRVNLKPDSLLFTSQTDESQPVNTKNISRAFRLAARMLEKTGAINYKIRKGKPSELRLYNLRKYFRIFANQMGFEHVNYLMGHITKGSDSSYTPKNDQFYRELYEKQAMPFLRFEVPTPTETTEIVKTLKEQHQKELEAIENKYKAENEELKSRLDKLENFVKSEDHGLLLKSRALIQNLMEQWQQENIKAMTEFSGNEFMGKVTGNTMTIVRAKQIQQELEEAVQKELSKPPTKAEKEELARIKRQDRKLKKAVNKAYAENPELAKDYLRKIIADCEKKEQSNKTES